MILSSLLSLILLSAAPQADMFKREMPAIQQAVGEAVTAVVARVLQPPKATYLDGYGVVVTLEVALTTPITPFSNPVKPGEVQAISQQKRRDLEQKVTAFMTQTVAHLDSLTNAQSLAVVVYILNTNPADVTNLPGQIVFSVKKDSPQQVFPRAF